MRVASRNSPSVSGFTRRIPSAMAPEPRHDSFMEPRRDGSLWNPLTDSLVVRWGRDPGGQCRNGGMQGEFRARLPANDSVKTWDHRIAGDDARIRGFDSLAA